jgi:hypothetical protein
VAVDVGQLLGGALGGAVASSVLGPLIGQRRERRDLRADVLRRVSAVEQAKWAPTPLEHFREAIVALRAAALVAQVHRELVEEYAYPASVGWAESLKSWDDDPDPEYGGYVDGTLADLIHDESQLLVDHVWHPLRSQLAVRRRRARLRERKQALREHQPMMRWDPPRV